MADRYSRSRFVIVCPEPKQITALELYVAINIDSSRYNISPGTLYAELEQIAADASERMRKILTYALKPIPKPKPPAEFMSHLPSGEQRCKYCGVSYNSSLSEKLKVGSWWVERTTNRRRRIMAIDLPTGHNPAVVCLSDDGSHELTATWTAPEFISRYFEDRRA